MAPRNAGEAIAQGQLGDGSTIDRLVPVQVQGLRSGVTAISAGSLHTCAIRDGAVTCWGRNDYGQLGNGSTDWSSVTPVAAQGLGAGITAVAAGALHTCAIVDGAAQCWGHNEYGQLGDGTTENRLSPVHVLGLDAGVTAMSAGGQTCAIVDGAAQCWGINYAGQLGNGTRTDSATPVSVIGL